MQKEMCRKMRIPPDRTATPIRSATIQKCDHPWCGRGVPDRVEILVERTFTMYSDTAASGLVTWQWRQALAMATKVKGVLPLTMLCKILNTMLCKILNTKTAKYKCFCISVILMRVSARQQLHLAAACSFK